MAAAPFRKSSSATRMSAAATSSTRSRKPASSMRCSRPERSTQMNGSSTFRVGLIQMRSGRTPADNMDAAAKMIGEAKDGGADYVQTPEMTNILERSREKPVRQDRAGRKRRLARDVPRACARARHLCACRLARREGVARQGGQPLVPDRPRAARSSRATTRSTCSTSTSKAARAIASRAAIVRAISRSSPTCRGAGSA